MLGEIAVALVYDLSRFSDRIPTSFVPSVITSSAGEPARLESMAVSDRRTVQNTTKSDIDSARLRHRPQESCHLIESSDLTFNPFN